MTTRLLGLALAGLLFTLPAIAQDGHGDHGTHDGHGPAATSSDVSPSTEAFMAANDKMHADMEIEFTGNADVDFVRGMIAHHQGAIDMAEVVIEYGTDPEIRRLAEDVIAAQTAEIGQMEAWLTAQGQ